MACWLIQNVKVGGTDVKEEVPGWFREKREREGGIFTWSDLTFGVSPTTA